MADDLRVGNLMVGAHPKNDQVSAGKNAVGKNDTVTKISR